MIYTMDVTDLLNEIVVGTKVILVDGFDGTIMFQGKLKDFYNDEGKESLKGLKVGDVAIKDNHLLVNMI